MTESKEIAEGHLKNVEDSANNTLDKARNLFNEANEVFGLIEQRPIDGECKREEKPNRLDRLADTIDEIGSIITSTDSILLELKKNLT